jgi:TetR/AcrR family transcriptional repressor of nem operon
VSVKDIMRAAGLTHGGFYGHFSSKDELAATACARAFSESGERWRKRVAAAKDRSGARAALIKGYLSAQNIDARELSCPIAALATDVARESKSKPVRKMFLEGLERLIDILSATQAESGSRAAREKALAQISTLVGATLLARATGGTELSKDITDAVRRSLLEDIEA